MKTELSLIVKSVSIITESLIEMIFQPMEQSEDKTLPYGVGSEELEMAQQIIKQAKKIMPSTFTADVNISKIILTHRQYEELGRPTCGDIVIVGLELSTDVTRRGEVIK